MAVSGSPPSVSNCCDDGYHSGKIVTHNSSVLNDGNHITDGSNNRTAVSDADSTIATSKRNRYDLGCSTT
ncbi:hypothetical protein AVEN_60814-1 [Araneus ventricosus]|uniref:Uncharacterized protein n=1 Tax=Araneus ventricosus TaxID=182803 RepID=A0A4Y2HAF9_ARAVE|nr:hypothetical protein AVEN_60814-1 [Araneus ventricosus]